MSSIHAAAERLDGIEATRAIAAISVLLMHATHLMRVPQFSGEVGLGGVFDFGYVGVDVFFVLSGFIITYVHHSDLGQGWTRCPGYLWRRFVRLFPIYWLVLALTIAPSVLNRMVTGRTPLLDLAPDDVAGTLLLWIGARPPVYVGVAWSLQFEVLFYLGFCVLLMHRQIGAALLAVWAASVLAQAAGAWRTPLPLSLGDPHCLQFLMGVLTGWLLRRPRILHPASVAVTSGITQWWDRALHRASWPLSLGLLILAVVLERVWLTPHGMGGRLALGISAAVLIGSLVMAERRGALQVPRALVSLGACSYSLYLVHCLLLNLCFALLAALGLYHRLPQLAVFLVAVAVAMVGGWALGRFVERPLVRWLRQWRVNSGAPVASPAT